MILDMFHKGKPETIDVRWTGETESDRMAAGSVRWEIENLGLVTRAMTNQYLIKLEAIKKKCAILVLLNKLLKFKS